MTIMPMDGGMGGRPMPWDRRRGGLFGSQPPMQQQPDTPAMTAQAQPLAQKKGFDWGKLIGVLGDSLSIAGGGAPQYVPMMQQQRLRRDAQAYAEQQYQRRRGDEQQDWQRQQDYKRENPDPDYFDDNAGNRWQINPSTGERKLIFRDPTQKHVQQVVTDPDGSQRLVQVPIPNNVNPDGTFGNASIGGMVAPIAPKGKLTPYNGGQTATPSGNFR